MLPTAELYEQIKIGQRLLAERLERLAGQISSVKVDSEFITIAEYQVFLAATWKNGRFYQPLHWHNYFADNGNILEPVIGVTGYDAQQFVEWLSRYNPQGLEVILPNLAQATAHPSNNPNIAGWCLENNSFKLENSDSITLSMLGIKEPRYEQAGCKTASALFGTNNRDVDFVQKSLEAIYPSLREAVNPTSPRHRMVGLATNTNVVYMRDFLDFYRVAISQGFNVQINVAEVILSKIKWVGYEKITRLIEEGNITDAQKLITKLTNAQNQYLRRQGLFLNTCLELYLTQNFIEYRKASRKHLQLLCCLAYTGLTGSKVLNPNNHKYSPLAIHVKVYEFFRDYPIQFPAFLTVFDSNEPVEKRVLAKIYWCMKVLVEREEGQLKPFEGIRIALKAN